MVDGGIRLAFTVIRKGAGGGSNRAIVGRRNRESGGRAVMLFSVRLHPEPETRIPAVLFVGQQTTRKERSRGRIQSRTSIRGIHCAGQWARTLQRSNDATTLSRTCEPPLEYHRRHSIDVYLPVTPFAGRNYQTESIQGMRRPRREREIRDQLVGAGVGDWTSQSRQHLSRLRPATL